MLAASDGRRKRGGERSRWRKAVAVKSKTVNTASGVLSLSLSTSVLPPKRPNFRDQDKWMLVASGGGRERGGERIRDKAGPWSEILFFLPPHPSSREDEGEK